MTLEEIKRITTNIIKEYPITKVTLFGSRADNTNKENSDVDFIVEFSEPVSLITIAKLQLKLENALNLDVDIIHGPLRQDDMVEINKEVEIYAA